MKVSDTEQRPVNRPLFSNARTVLLVEDDAAVRSLVARILNGEGYSVLKAKHSAEALYFSGEYTGVIHLLLTDVCMAPYMNGRRLAESIRASRPGIPVLYMSGFVDDEEVAQEIGSGEAWFLSKPFTPLTLLNAVRKSSACVAGNAG